MAKSDTIREAANIASTYYTPGDGNGTQKDSLKKKVKMALMGRRYKTDTAKRILKKKKKMDESESYNTRMKSAALRQSISEEELRKLKGK